ncbi:MAG: sel1 repeat family protein [Akkermansia sp.]|nr:sel1 repeat family protein [Akkermansia sp.]
MKTLSLFSLILAGGIALAPSLYGYYDVRTIPGRVAESSNARQLLEDARAGDVDAMRILGKQLIDGTTMKRDLKNGVLWLKKAVEAGDNRSMVMLGDLYYHGRAVSQNQKKALELYMQAAEAGNKNAVKRLEKLPLKSAVSWWESRAEDGDKKAVLKLMRAYATGKGLPKDMEKAREYYELAVEEWPEDTEKVLDKLSEEQRTALVPPPPPPAKPEPIVQTPTKPAKPQTSAPVPSVTDWKYVRCDSKYCIDATQSKCEELYRYYLTQSNKQLYIIANDYNDDDVPIVAYKALCYFLLGESNRLTLMSKYGVTSAQLNREYGQLLSEFRELVTRIYKLCEQYPNSENSTTAIVMLTIIMDSHASTTPPDDLLKKCFAKACETFLLLTDICLSNVQSSDNTGAAGLAWDFYLGYVYLKIYLQMNKPGLSHVADLKLYDECVDSISEECRRIKQANYYGSDDIKQAIIFIYGK